MKGFGMPALEGLSVLQLYSPAPPWARTGEELAVSLLPSPVSLHDLGSGRRQPVVSWWPSVHQPWNRYLTCEQTHPLPTLYLGRSILLGVHVSAKPKVLHVWWLLLALVREVQHLLGSCGLLGKEKNELPVM